MDYKSSVNKRISVLDYLTKVIITKCPHIAALEEDLKHVQQASRGISFHWSRYSHLVKSKYTTGLLSMLRSDWLSYY